MIKYLIFDLDNTIYPSSAKINEQIPLRMINFIADFLDISFEEAKNLRKERLPHFSSTLEWLTLEHDLKNYNDFLEKVHPEEEKNELPEIPGLIELFESIKLPKAVLTNAPAFHAERVLDFYGISHCFTNIHDIIENKLKGKPFPSAYKNVLEKEGFDIEETLFFDDHPKYVKGYMEIGGNSVLVDQNDVYQNIEIPKTGTMKKIHSVFEIPRLLESYK